VTHDERLGPDLLRGRDKSIGGDLYVDDKGSEQSFKPLQSLHHCSIGYQPLWHELTLPRRLIPASAIKNTSKNEVHAIWIADEWLSSQVGVSQTVTMAKLFLTDWSKQNPYSNGAVATDYKGSRDVQVPPRRNPNGLDTIHGPKAKNGGIAPRQILDVQLFWRFMLIPDEFGHGTSSIGKNISLPFHRTQECPNWMSYAI
jgi:hypothetical protein